MIQRTSNPPLPPPHANKTHSVITKKNKKQKKKTGETSRSSGNPARVPRHKTKKKPTEHLFLLFGKKKKQANRAPYTLPKTTTKRHFRTLVQNWRQTPPLPPRPISSPNTSCTPGLPQHPHLQQCHCAALHSRIRFCARGADAYCASYPPSSSRGHNHDLPADLYGYSLPCTQRAYGHPSPYPCPQNSTVIPCHARRSLRPSRSRRQVPRSSHRAPMFPCQTRTKCAKRTPTIRR